MRYAVAGTAGHIDHGKSALVRALTGTDPDRLEEEKRRGMTIDLGFAHLDLPSGLRVGLVDVPGHERLIKNMLAGAAGLDLVLLVIAADEGVMPQTREHLDILRFLRVGRGLVVLNKADLVRDPEWLARVGAGTSRRCAAARFSKARLSSPRRPGPARGFRNSSRRWITRSARSRRARSMRLHGSPSTAPSRCPGSGRS
jgi:small GTP-binding protein